MRRPPIVHATRQHAEVAAAPRHVGASPALTPPATAPPSAEHAAQHAAHASAGAGGSLPPLAAPAPLQLPELGPAAAPAGDRSGQLAEQAAAYAAQLAQHATWTRSPAAGTVGSAAPKRGLEDLAGGIQGPWQNVAAEPDSKRVKDGAPA